MSGIITNPVSINSLISMTLHRIEDTIADNIYRSNVLLAWIKKMDRIKIIDGGESITTPILIRRQSTVQRYSGFDTLSLTPQDNVRTLVWDWKQYAATIAFSGLDSLKNDGVARIISRIEELFEEGEMGLRNFLNGDAFDESSTKALQITGLQSICQAAAEAAQTFTVGGFPKSSLNQDGERFLTNVFDNVNSNTRGLDQSNGLSFGDTGLDCMNYAFDTASEGADSPDIMITTIPGFENYQKSLQPQQRFSVDMGDARFRNLLFANAPVVFDKACPANRMFGLNMRWLTWYTHRRRNFIVSDPTSPDNQDAQYWKILWAGNLACRNFHRQFVITNVDTF
jgi:hypothetical protein